MTRLIGPLIEPIGFGLMLAAVATMAAAGLYHDLGLAILRPMLLVASVSSLIAGTVAWLLLGRPNQPGPALSAGILAGFLTVAIGTGLYASISLIPIALLLIGPIVSVAAAGLALAYSWIMKQRAARMTHARYSQPRLTAAESQPAPTAIPRTTMW